MKAYCFGEPTGSFVKACRRLHARCAPLFWLIFPVQALLVVMGVYSARCMVRIGLIGIRLAHALGFDPLEH